MLGQLTGLAPALQAKDNNKSMSALLQQVDASASCLSTDACLSTASSWSSGKDCVLSGLPKPGTVCDINNAWRITGRPVSEQGMLLAVCVVQANLLLTGSIPW